jgi:hypothetical protein
LHDDWDFGTTEVQNVSGVKVAFVPCKFWHRHYVWITISCYVGIGTQPGSSPQAIAFADISSGSGQGDVGYPLS